MMASNHEKRDPQPVKEAGNETTRDYYCDDGLRLISG
jgi:hypothetical protein